jgi:hypothetical protein
MITTCASRCAGPRRSIARRAMMPHTQAAICRLGEVVSRDVEQDPAPARCPRCGVTAFSRCVNCDAPVRGPEYELVQGYEPLTLYRRYEGDYEPPTTCYRCRASHPWAKLLRALNPHRAA